MKKGHKFLALSLLGLFVLSILAMALVPAPDAAGNPPAAEVSAVKDAVNSGSSNIGSTLKSWFEGVFGKTLDIKNATDQAVTKFLVFFLIFLIILAIADSLPFLEDNGTTLSRGKKVLRFLIAGVVAYISVAYITPAEFYASLVSYQALAVTLTTIIPFAIILTVAWKLSNNPTPVNILLQKFALGIFASFLTYKVFALYILSPTGTLEGFATYAAAIYLPVLVITLIMLFANTLIRQWFLNQQITGYVEESKTMNKQELLANSAMLKEKSDQLWKMGDAPGAKQLADASDRMAKLAKA